MKIEVQSQVDVKYPYSARRAVKKKSELLES